MDLMEMINAKRKAMQKGEKTARIPDGVSEWRLLPNPKDVNSEFWHDFGQHYIKGSDGSIKAVFTCHDKTFGTQCAVCEAIEVGMSNTLDDKVLDQLKQSKSGQRTLVNAIQIDGDDKSPQILELPPSVFNDILGIIQSWGADKILSLDKSQNLVIEKSGKGLQTRYSVQASPRQSTVSKDTLAKAKDLREFVARETDETERRALASVQSVAGAIGFTSRSSAPKADLSEVIDVDGTLDVEMTPSTSSDAVDDVLAELDSL